MLKKVLKGGGILLGALLVLALLGVMALFVLSEERLNRVYSIPASGLEIPERPAAVERGRVLVETRGFCTDCHGENLSGQAFDDGWLVGRVSIRNLTRGEGGLPEDYSDEDWVRAIRHGVGRDGKPLLDMPSNFYYEFSDEDLGAVIAYLKGLPPVDKVVPKERLGLLARVFILTTPSLLPANLIDHQAPRPPAPEPGVNAAYGEYLATTCKFCHGADLAGRDAPGAGLNLTPGGNLGHWTESGFIQAIRIGVTPDGEELNQELMPWDKIAGMSDDELKAIWLYLRTLAPVAQPVSMDSGR